MFPSGEVRSRGFQGPPSYQYQNQSHGVDVSQRSCKQTLPPTIKIHSTRNLQSNVKVLNLSWPFIKASWLELGCWPKEFAQLDDFITIVNQFPHFSQLLYKISRTKLLEFFKTCTINLWIHLWKWLGPSNIPKIWNWTFLNTLEPLLVFYVVDSIRPNFDARVWWIFHVESSHQTLALKFGEDST